MKNYIVFVAVTLLSIANASAADVELFPIHDDSGIVQIAVSVSGVEKGKLEALQFGLNGVNHTNFIECTNGAFCNISQGRLAAAVINQEKGLNNDSVLFEVVLKQDGNLKANGKMELEVIGNTQIIVDGVEKEATAKIVY